MPPTDPPSVGWRLYAPNAEELLPLSVPRPGWIGHLKIGPPVSIDDVEDFYPVPGVAPCGWTCFVLPDYILSHTFVAAILSSRGSYAMLFFQKVGPTYFQQQRPPKPNQIGWFMFTLVEPVESLQALQANLRHALRLLEDSGVLSAE